MPLYTEQKRRAIAKSLIFDKKSLELELQYLKDPLRLANHTLGLLQSDKNEKAAALVRLASKNVLCTVSWNHLIGYEMSKGKVNRAVKLFNEA